MYLLHLQKAYKEETSKKSYEGVFLGTPFPQGSPSINSATFALSYSLKGVQARKIKEKQQKDFSSRTFWEELFLTKAKAIHTKQTCATWLTEGWRPAVEVPPNDKVIFHGRSNND